DRPAARRGYRRVRAEHEQSFHAALAADAVEHLERRAARPGELVRAYAPDPRHVRAGRRVVDAAIAGQLVGLLAVLAASLPIALARERPEAAAQAARKPEAERQVHEGEHVGDALGLLLGAARREHHRRT